MPFTTITLAFPKDEGWRKEDLESMLMAFCELQNITVFVISDDTGNELLEFMAGVVKAGKESLET